MEEEGFNIGQADLAKLSPADARDLQQFLRNEEQKSTVQKTIHDLTSMCFKKCITSPISGRLAGREESCMANCVDRFMDSNLAILKKLEEMRHHQ